ncbi:MAG: hypothetical protein COB83_01970 [Gammaproteobacteria bacterium]|nr:MAG: hypothetical protein COB83_01970 [Gammaproteobacteria bacterium]
MTKFSFNCLGTCPNITVLDDTPDITHKLIVDSALLPLGNYTDIGEEVRQVVDIEFKRVVTEYRAQILENELGQRFVAKFPKDKNLGRK